MKTNPDDNAFQEGSFGRTNTLTKREYFAALILQGLLSSKPTSHGAEAESAVIRADELIQALNKVPAKVNNS